ncbi:DUF2627 domain-containing protein, partial [Shigella flexneri]
HRALSEHKTLSVSWSHYQHVDVEYRFSAEPYIGASCSNVSVLSMLCLRAKKTI